MDIYEQQAVLSKKQTLADWSLQLKNIFEQRKVLSKSKIW